MNNGSYRNLQHDFKRDFLLQLNGRSGDYSITSEMVVERTVRPYTNTSICDNLFLGRRWELTRHSNSRTQSTDEDDHECFLIKPRRIRSTTWGTLHALHTSRYLTQGFHLRRSHL